MVVDTRTTTEINNIIEEKFNELKQTLVSELKDELKILITSQMTSFKEDILSRYDELSSTVAVLQQHVQNLKEENVKLSNECMRLCDENEQYGRRLCVRVKGIKKVENENSDKILEEVKKLFDDAEIQVPDCVVDRAHRVSKNNDSVIVRFTSFRYRTLFYRNRQKLQNKNVKVHLDLTKKRLSTLIEARSYIHDFNFTEFVYADINCRLKLRCKDGKEYFFDSLPGLQNLVLDIQSKH